MAIAIKDGLIGPGETVLDYGCGRGGDVSALQAAGVAATGWDPAYAPATALNCVGVVNLGYVVNVIEDAEERSATLRSARNLATRILIVSARLTDELPERLGPALADGVMTRIGTFQKFFEQQELRAWIDATLGVQAIAASPGIFYVFVDERLRARHLSTRQSRGEVAQATVRPPRDKSQLEPLVDFLAAHGRPPELAEMPGLGEIVGSGGRARAVMEAMAFVHDIRGAPRLYDDTTAIGTERGWNAALDRAGVHIRGHRLHLNDAPDGKG